MLFATLPPHPVLFFEIMIWIPLFKGKRGKVKKKKTLTRRVNKQRIIVMSDTGQTQLLEVAAAASRYKLLAKLQHIKIHASTALVLVHWT